MAKDGAQETSQPKQYTGSTSNSPEIQDAHDQTTTQTQAHTGGSTSDISELHTGQSSDNEAGSASKHGQTNLSQSHSVAPINPAAHSTVVHPSGSNSESHPQGTSPPDRVQPSKVPITHTEKPLTRNSQINNTPNPKAQVTATPTRVASLTSKPAVVSHNGHSASVPKGTTFPNLSQPVKASDTHHLAPPTSSSDTQTHNHNPNSQSQRPHVSNNARPTEVAPSNPHKAPSRSSIDHQHTITSSIFTPQKTSPPEPAKVSNSHNIPAPHISDIHFHNNNPQNHSKDSQHHEHSSSAAFHTSNAKVRPQETPHPGHIHSSNASDIHTQAPPARSSDVNHSSPTPPNNHSFKTKSHINNSKSLPKETPPPDRSHTTKILHSNTHSHSQPTHTSVVHSKQVSDPHSQKPPPPKHTSATHSHGDGTPSHTQDSHSHSELAPTQIHQSQTHTTSTDKSKSHHTNAEPPHTTTKGSPAQSHTAAGQDHTHASAPPQASSKFNHKTTEHHPVTTQTHQAPHLSKDTASAGKAMSHFTIAEPSRISTKGSPAQSRPAIVTNHSHAPAPPHETSTSNHRSIEHSPVTTQIRQTPHPSKVTATKTTHSTDSPPQRTALSQSGSNRASTIHNHNTVSSSHGVLPMGVSDTGGFESHSAQQTTVEPTPSPILAASSVQFQSITQFVTWEGMPGVSVTKSSTNPSKKVLDIFSYNPSSSNLHTAPSGSPQDRGADKQSPSSDNGASTSIEPPKGPGTVPSGPGIHSKPQNTQKPSSHLSGPAVIGICIAVIFTILLIAFILFGLLYYRRKHRKLKKELLRYHADRNVAPPVYVPGGWKATTTPYFLDVEGQVRSMPNSSYNYLSKDNSTPYMSRHPSVARKTSSMEKQLYSDFDNVAAYRYSKMASIDEPQTLTSNEIIQTKTPLYQPPQNSNTILNSSDSHRTSFLRSDTLYLSGQESARTARSPSPQV
ncbi:hypothetical protein JR316_0000527 [Psilocybe cubensis]|uniref:Uncharacterized protein n=2 Tax=Psilocybe cubensis TaxID=181762 RepID=A0A8H7YA45_PSICU|nr:hypothetical protein JR316_0000527 [Psilocybe cubensis]KAH9486462.1 hypothetical protein JR316_0000527 [Psilocybe cubensis]